MKYMLTIAEANNTGFDTVKKIYEDRMEAFQQFNISVNNEVLGIASLNSLSSDELTQYVEELINEDTDALLYSADPDDEWYVKLEEVQ